jgi:hypothetical protein
MIIQNALLTMNQEVDSQLLHKILEVLSEVLMSYEVLQNFVRIEHLMRIFHM